MSDHSSVTSDFDTHYRPLLLDAFVDIVQQDLQNGGDAGAQATHYAEQGKPDFVLAYLLISDLPDADRREVYALAHERRAAYIERKAREFSKEFHRPFPLLHTEAAKDRALARQIRVGRATQPGQGRQLPMR